MNEVVIITGGSSGIGKCTAAALAEKGCIVYEFSRRDCFTEGIVHVKTDITNELSVKNSVDYVIEKEGRIDILINNAGFGISGAVEFTDTEEATRLFDVNFFGMVRMSKAVIPYMRENGHGKIVNISSVAAVAPIPFQTYYSAAKAAINSYSMAAANELHGFGISVCAVMPGDIKTGFTDARLKNETGDDIYGGKIKKSVAGMEKDERGGMDPAAAGKIISKIAIDKVRKPIYTIGIGYKVITVLIKILPSAVIKLLIRLLYT